MKLVEIVKGEKTSDETITKLNEYTKKIGKTPVICTDTKGFIVNRLLVPYMLESARLVERGVATVEDVDTAMRLGAGYPMGPFTLCDSVGIDVIKLITDAWHKEEPDNALFFPVKSIDEKVAQGKLGRKTGEGFYKYTK
jgi:3-hydroxyacyl-CoA dehydrogenase